MNDPIYVTIQGGWLDGKTIPIPAGQDHVNVIDDPHPTPVRSHYTTSEAADLLNHQLRLPIEHIAADQYLARWPIREDPRYCPQCACPPAEAHATADGWDCTCRFDHAWRIPKRALRHYPPSSRPAALREPR